MCSRCDGYSEHDLARALDVAILVTGFGVQVVEPEGGSPGWCYSIGLNETADHPDLVVIDIEPELQRELIGMLGRAVVAGESLTELLETIDVELVPVHPKNLDGDLVTTWWRRNRRYPERGEFLQVLPGASWFCSCHAHRRRRLDVPIPAAGLTEQRSNRAQRRAARRR